ncbi:MAG: hypothetical protein IKE89_05695 [Bacilli bacterium]|nr:hypothetical protein [Bacilli bacterium]
MEIDFNNIEDLYIRVLPSLRLKQRLLMKQGHSIGISNIWDYLTKEKWAKANNLTLYDIVNDIMTLDAIEVINYYKEV